MDIVLSILTDIDTMSMLNVQFYIYKSTWIIDIIQGLDGLISPSNAQQLLGWLNWLDLACIINIFNYSV